MMPRLLLSLLRRRWIEAALLLMPILVTTSAMAAVGDAEIPGLPIPPTYVVLRTPDPIRIDGKLDDKAWSQASRTRAWQWLDTGESARLSTYGQMAWDDDYLYVAFRTEDPDVWSTMLVRDEPVYTEEDFEIFLDPDGDEFDYYEWQINPLGTLYDVIWTRPVGTPGSGGRGVFGFDVTPMLTGHQVRGTVWERADTDSGWTAEVALSWEGLARMDGRFGSPPQPGDSWRIGFSRVEVPQPPLWQADWTWPIHGEYNMHIGQRDAFVQFSAQELGRGDPKILYVPQLRAVDVELQTADGDDDIEPGEVFTLVPRIDNRGTTDGRDVEAILVCEDSLVTVLDSTARVGRVPRGGEALAREGFQARLSQAAGPGRTLLFRLFLNDDKGHWWGDYFFEFAAGRGWQTFAQTHEGVRDMLFVGDEVWGLSRPNVWRWRADGTVAGFHQPDDGLPRHADKLVVDGGGRVWAAGRRGVAFYTQGTWTDLTGRDGLPARDIDALAAGLDGDMWLATRAGLFRYGHQPELVWGVDDGYPARPVRDLLVDRGGTAWVVTDSLLHVAGFGPGLPPGDAVDAAAVTAADGTEPLRRVLAGRHGLPSNKLTAVVEDGQGQVWVGGVRTAPRYHDGGVGRWDGAAWTVWRVDDGLAADSVSALFVDAADRVWAAHPDGALSVFDGQAWDRWPGRGSAACAQAGSVRAPCVGPIHDLAQDGAGRIWVVGRTGAALLQDGAWRSWTERRGLYGQRAYSVAVDPLGRAWLGDDRSLSRWGE